MKNAALVFLMLTATLWGYAQNKQEAENLVNQGVKLHDKGDFAGAITQYDKALALDKDNLLALYEKSYSLSSLNQFDDVIAICQQAIKTHPNEDLKVVYVNYGNALDHLKKTKESIAVFDEAIKLYPDFFLLHFNKGITFSKAENLKDAIGCFQKSVQLHPKHAGSLNAIGTIEMGQNRIASILAFSRFLIVEPQTARSKTNFSYLQKMLMKGVSETGEKSLTININADMLNEATLTGQKKENNFSMTDLILSMDASQDFIDKNKKKTEVENFIRKFETICASLKENKKENFGFYWEFLAPYFIEMKNKDMIEPFAYIVYVDSKSEDVTKWHEKNQDKLDKFYEWSSNYKWTLK